MNQELSLKHYRKKPKDILVMDCVYMDSELKAAREAHLRKCKEYDALQRKLGEVLAKMNCLAHVNGKLTDAVASLRDGILIGR